MATTFTLIQTYTLGSAAASIDFTSISATYTDLCLKVSTRDNSASTLNNMYLTFNNTTTGYSNRTIIGQGTGTPVSYAASGLAQIEYTYSVSATSTASTFANTEYYIPNAFGSTYKSISIDNVTENNATTAWATMTAGLWSNTAAITSIKLTSASASFVQYSSASLYGILKA
jgi:hypothetical protein